MMNYQKLQEKLNTSDRSTLEKIRFISILVFVLVFGVLLKNIVLNTQDDKSNRGKPISQNKTIIEQKPRAATAEAIRMMEANTAVKNEIVNIPPIAMENTPSKQQLEKTNPMSNYAVAAEVNPNFLPIKNYDTPDIDLKAKAAIAMTEDGKIIFKQNIDQKMPIASLTKIVTALIVMENSDLQEDVVITQNAINTEGAAGRFTVGEKFKVEDLIKIMLLISSNDAAVALEDHLKIKNLNTVELMNKKAKELNLQNSYFENVIGLDDKDHYSSVEDYAKLVAYAIKTRPKLLDIISERSAIVKSVETNPVNRKIISNHQLVHDKDLKNIIGGKTGFTQDAGGCLMTIFNVIKKDGETTEKIITVVIGASDTISRFEEGKKLINWINNAYIF